jgi:hypothetical protein
MFRQVELTDFRPEGVGHYNMLNQLFNMAICERVTNDNPRRLVSRTVLKNLPTWQNRDRWLNKYSPDEEERLFVAFGEYGQHVAAICRIVLNTGIRPPKEVSAIRKEHVNPSDDQRYCKVERTDVLIPPRAVLVAKGKNGRPRVLPLNRTALYKGEPLSVEIAEDKNCRRLGI